MSNKIIIGLLVVALVANGVIGSFVFMQKGDINTLVDEQAAARQEAAAEAAAQAEQLETARQEITALIGENADSITDLEEGVEANLDSINHEAGRITALGSSLSSLSTEISSIVPGLAADVAYQKVVKAVVEISDGEETVGAGFLWDNFADVNDYVLTACHVIEDLNDIYVIFYDGKISRATVVGTSIRSDVALLELENPTNLQSATMADSDKVAIGDHALVIGHPFAEDNSLTVGVVSQLDRFEGIGSGQDERWIANLIQFDAPANFGNSGGPVYNEDGEVIGMVIGGIIPFLGHGVSYAVSSNKLNLVARCFCSSRMDDPERTPLGHYTGVVLGIVAADVKPREAEAAGRETVYGAVVKEVVLQHPESDHIQVGDIIVAIGNHLVRDVGDLASYICFGSGAEIIIHVIRGGLEMELTQKRMMCSDETWLIKASSGQWF